MRYSELIVEHQRKQIANLNKKFSNLLENRFPKLPSPKVFFNRHVGDYVKEWSQFKKNLIQYQLNYDDGTEFCKLKMRKLFKFISENYNDIEVSGLTEVKSLLKNTFKNSVEIQDLKIGEQYDVAVIYLDKLSKIIEINVHHNHTIKNIQFSKIENEYVVTTVEGLQGTTVIDKIDEIETLCFQNNGEIESLLVYLTLKIQPEYEGWSLSIIDDSDYTG